MTKGKRRKMPPAQRTLFRFIDGMLKTIAPALAIMMAGLLFAGSAPIDGIALFEKGRYHEARKVLGELLAKQPDAPRVQFYMGRTYLALEDAEQALPHFTKAVALEPEQTLYHFWLGVTYWALLDLDRELAAYEQALALDSNFLPAHVYAGHNQLDRGHWAQALEHYESVLEKIPDHPEALYNAGLALNKLGRHTEAVVCWQRYLEHHRTGSLAIGAVRQLNAEGNFSYRAYPIGKRFVIGPSPGFRDGNADIDPAMAATLDEIGAVVETLDGLTLHIVAFVKDNEPLAAERAKTLQHFIRHHFPNIPARRVRASWFGEAERIQDHPKMVELKASMKLFTAP